MGQASLLTTGGYDRRPELARLAAAERLRPRLRVDDSLGLSPLGRQAELHRPCRHRPPLDCHIAGSLRNHASTQPAHKHIAIRPLLPTDSPERCSPCRRIPDGRHRRALRSTRNRSEDSSAPRRQLDGGVPPAANGVLAAERSWWLLAQATSARRNVQPVSSGRASSSWSTLPAGTPRRRSPVSGMRCPPSGFGVRDPAVQPSGVRSPGAVVQSVRRSAVCCPPIQRPAVRSPAVRSPAVRSPAVWCLPPSIRTRPSPPMLRRWRWEPRSSWPGDRDHRNGCRPLWLPSRRRLDRRSRRPDAGDAAKVGLVNGRSVADPGRRVGCGPPRPRLPTRATRQARPALGAPLAGGCAVGTGAGCSARWRHPPRGCRPRLGARPRWVVVAEPDARVGRPGGATGRAGGDGCAAPARPKPAASAPSSVPAAL
jgi:hypothetical protein